MEFFLQDMDDTLLTPRTYHFSLKEKVIITGRALGYAYVQLKPMDITAFEGTGGTSEWDSAAICSAIMLEN